MGKRRRALSHLPVPEITLTPLIDTVLVLLITFMIAMPVMQNTLNIELPSGAANESEAAGPAQSITIGISRDRHVSLNGNEIPYKSLVAELEKLVGARQDRVVSVEADWRVPYGDVARVVDDIKYLGGVRYVALKTDRQ